MINLYNFSLIKADKNLLRKVAQFVLKEEKAQGDLAIILVGEKRIRELNKKYRDKNEVTDVLSFEGDKNLFAEIKQEKEIGQVFICPEFVSNEAKKIKMDFEKGMALVLIHGILHLLGYNHIRKKEKAIMDKKQFYYLDSFWTNYH